jgi:hypothetical protein
MQTLSLLKNAEVGTAPIMSFEYYEANRPVLICADERMIFLNYK